jgi:hypothetical protein
LQPDLVWLQEALPDQTYVVDSMEWPCNTNRFALGGVPRNRNAAFIFLTFIQDFDQSELTMWNSERENLYDE